MSVINPVMVNRADRYLPAVPAKPAKTDWSPSTVPARRVITTLSKTRKH
jgi:hypothetical protein